MNMKSFSASSDSSDVWASSICSPQEEKPPKKEQIYSKEFQAMLDKLDREELGDDDVEEEGLLGFRGCGGGGKKKRRLFVDQVKALERSFDKENKLDPERKNRLAEDLGLQPRQVAIWFQNRRARWKTKQLERDYGVLKCDYDSLRADYDSLDQENKSLLSQLTELKMKFKEQVPAAEDNLDHDCQLVAKEECPVSESAVVVKPQFGYGSEIDMSSNSDHCSDALIKEEVVEEEEPIFLKAEADAAMPMSSPTSVCSLNHNNTSTASSGSSCTMSTLNWFHGWDSGEPMPGSAGKVAYVHSHPRAAAEEQQQGWLNFFSVDHAPTLHYYFAEDDGKEPLSRVIGESTREL